MKINKDGKICGYASVFHIKDLQGDRILPGAFLESITAFQENSHTVGMYVQHQPEETIGKWTKLEEDSHGLWVEGILDLQHPKTVMIKTAIERGESYGLSIGFRLGKTSTQNGIKTIHKLNLFEISLVRHPANPLASLGAL